MDEDEMRGLRVVLPEDLPKIPRRPAPGARVDRKCCCGNAHCTDFEDRMARWGIPLDEITEVTETIVLRDRR